MSFSMNWLAGLIVLTTIAGVAVGRYPRLRMNRATISLVGAVALVTVGGLTLEQAFGLLDMATIALLFSMMVINANLRLSGFFQAVTDYLARHARTPRRLLLLVIVVSGFLSALLLNDTIVLMFTPLVLEIVDRLRRDPVPYLIGLATAANIGSVATIVGNPQNMIIGIASGISFARFTIGLGPVALMGLLLAWVLIVLFFRAEFRSEALPKIEAARIRVHRPILRKSLGALVLMVAALLAGVPVTLAALGASSLLLITRRLKPDRVFREIDWSLLVFFSGLFVVTGSLSLLGSGEVLLEGFEKVSRQGTGMLTLSSAVMSNLVSNVPAVLLYSPMIPRLPDPERAWMVLAMATTFAGNLTLLGSVANLIVAETARRHGHHLSFAQYLKMGIPITLLTLVLGVIWLSY